MNRRNALALLTSAMCAIYPNGIEASGQALNREYVIWVAEVFKRMQQLQPGMTRANLLSIFTTEGGLSTGLQRTYVSRDCAYFKVDVTFRAVGRPNKDIDDRVTLVEDLRDEIVTISRPYLAWAIAD
jgi:hypothetical protein